MCLVSGRHIRFPSVATTTICCLVGGEGRHCLMTCMPWTCTRVRWRHLVRQLTLAVFLFCCTFSRPVVPVCYGSGIWSEFAVHGICPCPRAGHTMSRVGNDLYLYGGISYASCGYCADVWVLDCKRRRWKQVKPVDDRAPVGYAACFRFPVSRYPIWL